VFRVGDDDAKKLAESFSYFEAKDLRNLETGQAIVRVERGDFDFNLTVPLPNKPDEAAAAARRQEVMMCSREKYGTARADIETQLAKSRATLDEPPVSPTISNPPPASKPSVEDRTPAPSEMPESAEPPKPVVPPAKDEAKPSKVPETVTGGRPQGSPRDLGRGGAQHQAIQKRIKEAAEGFGFRSVIEKPVLEGTGSVDLWLERTGQEIACEISITTTIDHEVGNVAKCLKAGLPKVAVICLDEERLRKISNAVSGSLGAALAARVEYFQPVSFIAHLKALPPPALQSPETKYGGYKVKRSMPQLSAAEQKQKEDVANHIMAEAMRRK
jgi:hypothetical protein